MSKKFKSRITELQKQITEARNDYYNEQPKLSDKHFDALVDELKALDSKNPAVTAVGAPVLPGEWLKVAHRIPMGSLDKVNTPEELIKWVENLGSPELFVCEKLDGLSIELIYEDGKLIEAGTRGNGSQGENIFVNVIKMKGVKSKLSSDFTGSLRGEIMMTRSDHKKHFPDKANPRNAASGCAKRLDGENVEHLTVFVYQVLGTVEINTEQEQFEWLKKEGFVVPNHKICANSKETEEYWREYQDNIRETLDYEIDGLVVSINNLESQVSFGEHDMKPKGKIAWKFENAMAETILLNAIWTCGSMGRVTPVAVLEPVSLCGVVIERASLHNVKRIQDLGIFQGCQVLISRRNDVIPFVEEVIGTKDNDDEGKIDYPQHCPTCNYPTEFDGEYLICRNTLNCDSQKVGRLANWIKELNILEFGDKILEKLVESGKVDNVADLYRLTVNDLASLDRMGKRSAQKCYDLLWATTEFPLDILLGALSIPLIGGSSIRTIMAAGYKTLEDFHNLSVEQMEAINGIGPSRAQSLVKGLKQNKQLIEELLELGVKVKEQVQGSLTGKSICFTGKAENKRTDLEKWAMEAGAEVKNSVGKGLSMLVITDPENSTTSKANNARKFGTLLIDENAFLQMVGRG